MNKMNQLHKYIPHLYALTGAVLFIRDSYVQGDQSRTSYLRDPNQYCFQGVANEYDAVRYGITDPPMVWFRLMRAVYWPLSVGSELIAYCVINSNK